MLFTYYNESLDEIAGSSQLLAWTGEESPSSATMASHSIYAIAIPEEKAGLPFDIQKKGTEYIAVYPETFTSRFGYLSESERGNAIALVQSLAPGQLIHEPKGDEKVTISAINDLPVDIMLSIKWGESQSNHRLRAFSGMTTIPTLYVGKDVDISAWADTQGLLICGGWEG